MSKFFRNQNTRLNFRVRKPSLHSMFNNMVTKLQPSPFRPLSNHQPAMAQLNLHPNLSPSETLKPQRILILPSIGILKTLQPVLMAVVVMLARAFFGVLRCLKDSRDHFLICVIPLFYCWIFYLHKLFLYKVNATRWIGIRWIRLRFVIKCRNGDVGGERHFKKVFSVDPLGSRIGAWPQKFHSIRVWEGRGGTRRNPVSWSLALPTRKSLRGIPEAPIKTRHFEYPHPEEQHRLLERRQSIPLPKRQSFVLGFIEINTRAAAPINNVQFFSKNVFLVLSKFQIWSEFDGVCRVQKTYLKSFPKII